VGAAVGLLLVLGLGVPPPAQGQADSAAVAPETTAVAPDTAVVLPDTSRVPTDTPRPVADTLAADTTAADTTTATTTARPDTATEASSVPADPQAVRRPLYGRPVVDSLPALTPQVDVQHVLAQQPGSFLYDLGAVGWPHGWSPEGLGPHRSQLWLEGRPYNDPLTGRARFDLLPSSFLRPPGVDVAPGGAAVGVHARWRDYDQLRPITELRFRRDSNGQTAIEVGHSQKHTLSLFGSPGILQATVGYGGAATGGAYAGSDLRRGRRLWGRLRYQRNDWALTLSNLSARHRIGAHSGVLPPQGNPFSSIYFLPFCQSCSQNTRTRRRTYRNDVTARLVAPLLPGRSAPATVSATWTSNTFDFEPSAADTTWSVVLEGGHASVRQPLRVGGHALTLGATGSLWAVERSNVALIDGLRGSAHAFARDSVALGANQFVVDAGWHVTPEQQYPSGAVRWTRPLGPTHLSASVAAAGQRRSWFETDGFAGFVEPATDDASSLGARVLRGRVAATYDGTPVDVSVTGFAHQLRDGVDLYAPPPAPGQRLASADSVTARRTATPVRRVGATLTAGWRRDAGRGLYATGTGTALTTLNADASRLHTRLARTLPAMYGRGRIGARFVFFEDLITDLYVQARGWTQMNSRWYHPPTGRLVVPPATNAVPSRGPAFQLGPNGTVDVHAEIKLRGATLFFTFENVQSSFAPPGSTGRQATLTPGTFLVPVYPLPARQFRFGVHWPILD
jgi:hypothetical protein